jgi:SAM-dependent methyltransferase
MLVALRALPTYLGDINRYRRLDGAEHMTFAGLWPQLADRTIETAFDPQYLHQAVWATTHVLALSPANHIDVASDVRFVTQLSAAVPVRFIDIRPLALKLPNLVCLAGSLTALPLEDESVESISCLHVIEHIGLGRYGDSLDPLGSQLACEELARVLAPGGELLLSCPTGRPRVYFNAHRIHSPRQIIGYMAGLELVEFSFVDDAGNLHRDADPSEAAKADYGCGLYRFRRPRR